MRKIKNSFTITLVMLSFGLTSCAAWDAIKTVADDDGMHNELQIGDRQNRGTLGDSSSVGTVKAYKDGTVNVDQSSTKPKFLGEAEKVVINEMPWWVYIIACLAFWIAPGPLACVRKVREAFKRRSPVIGRPV